MTSAPVHAIAYLDESGTQRGAEHLSVACYVVDKADVGMFEHDWRRALRRRGIQTFHMVDFAHRRGAFQLLSNIDKQILSRRLVKIFRRFALFSVAVSLDVRSYAEIFKGSSYWASSYWFAVEAAMTGVAKGLSSFPAVASVEYVLEAGHADQNRGERRLRYLSMAADMAKRHRYSGHSFVPKGQYAGLEAADMLAYLWRLDQRPNRQRRRDLAELLQAPHLVRHCDTDWLRMCYEAMPRETKNDAALKQALGLYSLTGIV